MAPVREEEADLLAALVTKQTNKDTIQEYNRTADQYDEYFTLKRYRSPKISADAVLELFPESEESPRRSLKVFDVACGTGLLAARLSDAGFRDIDGLDPSVEMLRTAKERKLYNRLLLDTIGEHRIDVEDDTYDIVTLAGGFVPGHCPAASLTEMVRVCKPGGLLVFSMRLLYLITCEEYRKMEPLIKAMEEERLCKCQARNIVNGFYLEDQGVVYVIKKL